MIERLTEFGITQAESKIILVLFRKSYPLSGSEIAEETDVSKQYVFELLKKITRKNLIEEIPETPLRYYTTVDLFKKKIEEIEQSVESEIEKLENVKISINEKLNLLGLDNDLIEIYYLLLFGYETRKSLEEQSDYTYDIIRNRTNRLVELEIVEQKTIGNSHHYVPISLEDVIQREIHKRRKKWEDQRERLEKTICEIKSFIWQEKDNLQDKTEDVEIITNQDDFQQRLDKYIENTNRILTSQFIHISHNLSIFSRLISDFLRVYTDAAKRGVHVKCLVEEFFLNIVNFIDEQIIVDFLTVSPNVEMRIAPYPMSNLLNVNSSKVFEFPPLYTTLDNCVLVSGKTLVSRKIDEFFKIWERASDIRESVGSYLSKASWKKIEENMNKFPRYVFKIVICGPSNVGKTTLIQRFHTKKFIPKLKFTMGFDIKFRAYNIVVDGKEINARLQLWDFGGEERFRAIVQRYARRAHAIIFAMDSTEKETLEILGEYVKLLEQEKSVNVLISTKHDLPTIITMPEIIQFKKKYNIEHYYPSSSITGENVEEIFFDLATFLIKKVVSKSQLDLLPEIPG